MKNQLIPNKCVFGLTANILVKYFSIIFAACITLSSCDRENHFHLNQVGNNYVQHYAWWYNNKLYNMNLSFPVHSYWHYRNQSKTLPYNAYVKEDKNYEYLRYVCEELNKQVANDHLSDLETVNYVLSFVQQAIPYQSDPIGPTDYPRFPMELFCDMGGDCEDKAAAVCAILLTYNIKSVLIQVPGHEAVAISPDNGYGDYIIYNGRRYFIAETTNPDWRLGNAPDVIKHSQKITVLPAEQTAFFDRFSHENKFAYTFHIPVPQINRVVSGARVCNNRPNRRKILHGYHFNF